MDYSESRVKWTRERAREGQGGRDTASGSLSGFSHSSQCYLAGLSGHCGSSVGPNVLPLEGLVGAPVIPGPYA